MAHKPPHPASTPHTLKLLCSYGGKILPRHPDGKLRYFGGETRVLSVSRSIPFYELAAKLGDLCGSSVAVRCQLPNEDLDALVTVTSDEDLANMYEEYDRAAAASGGSMKIRVFLSSPKKSAPSSPAVCVGCHSSYCHRVAKPYAVVKKVHLPSYGYPNFCNGSQFGR